MHRSIRKNLLLGCCLLLGVMTVHARVSYTINEAWRFVRADSPRDTAVVSIPHTWNALDAVDETPGYYRGKGRYERRLHIGTEGLGKRILIRFNGVNQVAELFVNGHFVGRHLGGYTRFEFDITPFVKIGQPNDLVVDVDNSHNEDIPPLSADFTFFGGIYRDVSLLFVDSLHFSGGGTASSGVYVTTSEVSGRSATLESRVAVRNDGTQPRKFRIIQIVESPGGTEVARMVQEAVLEEGAETMVAMPARTISHPELWSPDTPSLYRLRSVLVDCADGRELDAVEETFGLRWFAFDADRGFLLNGAPLKLIGTCRHQCRKGVGIALSEGQHAEDIRLLKQIGGNFLRVSHYPQDPRILEMCDKLGIIATVEIPIVNAVTESDRFLTNSLHMAQEMVSQNFNHPSVVAWAYMNEILLRPPYAQGTERYEAYCQEIKRQAQAIEKLIRGMDSQRYTMMSNHGSLQAYQEAGLLDVAQIVGWNLYQGWYGGALESFGGFLDHFHAEYPDKPVLVTEFGADADVRLHSFQPRRFDFTVEYATLYHSHYFTEILKRPFVAGASVWNLCDFHSETRGDAVPHINAKGLMALDRTLKEPYLFYQSRLAERPVVSIGCRNWLHRAGVDDGTGTSPQPVRIFSNADEVSLIFNGERLGRFRVENGSVEVQVPFVDGENVLQAVIRTGEQSWQSDFYRCDFRMVPVRVDSPDFSELNVMLGSTRYFEERVSDICWIPELPYDECRGWGYIGGKPLQVGTPFGLLPAYGYDIRGTELDPLFQTQRTGIESFRADVPAGHYAVSLYWASLVPAEEREKLVYKLGAESDRTDTVGHDVFDVWINGTRVLQHFDLLREVGAERAAVKKFDVTVVGKEGIKLDFVPSDPQSVSCLNAIRIVKLN